MQLVQPSSAFFFSQVQILLLFTVAVAFSAALSVPQTPPSQQQAAQLVARPQEAEAIQVGPVGPPAHRTHIVPRRTSVPLRPGAARGTSALSPLACNRRLSTHRSRHSRTRTWQSGTDRASSSPSQLQTWVMGPGGAPS